MAPTPKTRRGGVPAVVETPVRCGRREISSGFDLICPECRHRRGRSCRGESRTVHPTKASNKPHSRRHLLPIRTAIGGATGKLKSTASRLFSGGGNTIASENVSRGQTTTKPDARGRLKDRLDGANSVQSLSDTAPSGIISATNAPGPPSLASLALEDQQQLALVGFTAGSSLPRTDSGYVSASDQPLPALDAHRGCVDEAPLSPARPGDHGGVDDADETTACSARGAILQADVLHDQPGISHKTGIAERLEQSIRLKRPADLPGALPHVTRAMRNETDREHLARTSRDVLVHSVKPRTRLTEMREPDSFDAENNGAMNNGVDLQDNVSSPGQVQADLAYSAQTPGLTETSSEPDSPSTSDPFKGISDQGDPVIPIPLAAVVRLPLSGDWGFVNHGPYGGRARGSTNWPGGRLTVNSPRTSRSSSRRRPNASGDDDNDDDDDDDGDQRPSKPPDDKHPKGPGSDSQPKRKFACPLHKADPSKHPGCSTFILHRVRDVKQHLRRRHLQQFYCDRCLALFVNNQTLHGHTCVPVNPPCTSLEYISARQSALLQPAHRLSKEQQLAAKENPGHSEEEGWFAVWEIILPGIPRPESPYHESDGAEEFRSYRQYHSQYSENMLRAGAQSCMADGSWPWFLRMPEAERESILQWFTQVGPRLVYDRWWSTRTSDEKESNSGTLSERSGPLTNLSQLDSGVGMGAQRPVSGCQLGVETVWPDSFPDPVGGGGYEMEQWSNVEPAPEPWSPAGAGAWAVLNPQGQGHNPQGLEHNPPREDHGPHDGLLTELSAMPSSGPLGSGF